MISTFADGSLTATGGGTEDFLSSPNVQGKFTLVVDLNDMAAGDVVELRIYKMVRAGGTSRRSFLQTYQGAQPANELVVVLPEIANDLTDTNAVRFSVTQTFGTAGVVVPWAVLKDDALTPTTTARTLDVTATGAAGIDWGNVENPTTALNLSGTNIDPDQVVASVSGAVGSVTADVGITQAGADKVFGASGAALAELPQAAPSATPSPRQAIMLPYMALRNEVTVDKVALEKTISNDAGTVIAKKTLSDDGTTYTEEEMVSGP